MIGLLVLGIVVVLYLINISRRNSKYLKMPPCPNKIPILGNIQLLLKSHLSPYVQFMNMSADLGAVFTFWFGDKPVVIINSFDVAKKVLYSRDFAGRPQRYTSSVYSRQFKGIITTDYNNEFASRVAIVKKSFSCFNQNNIESMLKEESSYFVKSINKRINNQENNISFNISEEIKLLATNTIWRLIFNKRFELHDTDYNSLLQMLDLLTEGLAVSNLIDGFPILRNIPIGKYLYIDQFNAIRDSLISRHVDEQSNKVMHNDIESFTDKLLSEHAQLSRDNVEIILSDIICAGIETVSCAFRYILLYLLLNKHIAEKCYNEIEKVIGKNKLTFDDIGNFHYVRAVISEVLRKSPIAPFGVPHKTTTDTSIMEFSIPQNTTLMINIYAIHHDSTVYSNPGLFNPERFIDDHGCYQSNDCFIPFSIGRRHCLGKQLAFQQLIFFTVTLLQSFHVEAPEDCTLSDEPVSFSNMKPREHNVKISQRIVNL